MNVDIRIDFNKDCVWCIFFPIIPNMFLLSYKKAFNIGVGRKNISVWAFYQSCKNYTCHEDNVWYHCTICHPEEPHHLLEWMKVFLLYTIINTSVVYNHVMSTHLHDHKAFTIFYDGKMGHERSETLMSQGSSQMRRKVEYSNSSISRVSYFIISNKKYNKGHTRQASFEG